MAETREFRTAVVLSVATGVAMGKVSMNDIHQLVSWLSGGEVYTHQLGAVFAEAKAAAEAALGDAWEPDCDRPDLIWNPEAVAAYVARMEAKLGPTMHVPPAAKPFHREDAVIADAIEQVGGDARRLVIVGGARGRQA